MFIENLVIRNIEILLRLSKGTASLEELADEVKCKEGELRSPIKMLTEQGLITEQNGVYSLSSDPSTPKQVLDTISPWLNYFEGTFYEIAKDAANLILTKSWDDVYVDDVLLYGSTLKDPNPKDIDMVILHSGHRLKEFSPYATSPKYDTEPATEEDERMSSFHILRQAGYKLDKSDSVAKHVGRRIAFLGAGTIPMEEIEHETKIRNNLGLDTEWFIDMYGVSNVFDIHVLKTDLLTDSDFAQERREEVIKYCPDPTYWHTVLSEGRLFDRSKDDFTMTIGEKYPKALSLFPSE